MDLILIVLVLFLLFGGAAIGDIGGGDNSGLVLASLRQTEPPMTE
jgi:hypothetical protein